MRGIEKLMSEQERLRAGYEAVQCTHEEGNGLKGLKMLIWYSVALEQRIQQLEKALKFQKDQNKMLMEGRRGL